jgi:hypothetical protein
LLGIFLPSTSTEEALFLVAIELSNPPPLSPYILSEMMKNKPEPMQVDGDDNRAVSLQLPWVEKYRPSK